MNSHKAKKHLGQNFLHDEGVIDEIIHSCNIEGQNIIEIGPGTGNLTRGIIKKTPKQLILIEKDKDLIDNLQVNFEQENITILNADALLLSIEKMSLDLNIEKFSIISNLPYNVGTRIIVNLMMELAHVNEMIFMLQQEVADRIMSIDKSGDYGKISVLINLLCEVEKVCDVAPESFNPMPRIQSSVIKIKPKVSIPSTDMIEKFWRFCRIAFSNRRKMLRSYVNKLPNLNLNQEVMNRYLSNRIEDLSPQEIFDIIEK